MDNRPPTTETAVDTAQLERILERCGRNGDAVIDVLHGVQELYHYLPAPALRYICDHSDITPATVTGVATFYTQFRLVPAGRHTVSVCTGTACHVKGASRITEALRRHLELPEDADTDTDRRFTVQEVGCLGCCSLAPAIKVDDVIYAHVTPGGVSDLLRDFLRQQSRSGEKTAADAASSVSSEHALGEVRIGLGSCCIASGASAVERAVRQTVRETNLPVRVGRVGCIGLCHSEPLIEIERFSGTPRLYTNVNPEDIPAILNENFAPPRLRDRLKQILRTRFERLYTDESWSPARPYAADTREPRIASFLGPQQHIATEGYGRMDPVSLPDYERFHGFEALCRVVEECTPKQVRNWIGESGLRGRGGGGFPTERKWESVAAAEAKTKYVVCNGDEGDPGAFMDRMLLESSPMRVVEGMIIAGYAVGARQGILFVRAEYPLALKRIREALRVCREAGYLGSNILGRGVSFEVRVRMGAGAFVCGEETALIASLEGRRGMPRLRPPYPSQHGFHGQPTLINNTETFSLVPWIVRHGPAAFAAIGTERSKGTKVFALAGKVNRGGLIEVPMGISIRRIVDDIAGGVPEGRLLKAVQVGGPSGGCIPERLTDTPIDYEALVEKGAMMGSGGLVVLDDADCMVEIARYFLEFAQRESCGKCTFCRIGTKRMLDILDRLCNGTAETADMEALERLAPQVKQNSLCGLGKNAPNPVLTILRYFREEVDAHVQGLCPAGRCKPLIQYRVTDDCIGCTRCAQRCPADAIEPRPYRTHEIASDKCVRCDACRQACPVGAIVIEPRNQPIDPDTAECPPST